MKHNTSLTKSKFQSPGQDVRMSVVCRWHPKHLRDFYWVFKWIINLITRLITRLGLLRSEQIRRIYFTASQGNQYKCIRWFNTGNALKNDVMFDWLINGMVLIILLGSFD